MADDNLDYVQDGFNPNTITVPRLRSLLVKHNVSYPSAAKKPQLVELFNENIAPQASKIRARYNKAKRSSMGIVDAATYDEDEEELDLPPPPTTRRSKSPRKASTRVKSEELDEPVSRSHNNRSSRSASRQLAPTSDTETFADTASRSTRRTRRTITPQPPIIKTEEPEDDDSRRIEEEDEESFFSNDNPFQSGSSPPPSRPTSSRRRTTGGESVKRKKSSRRQTGVPVRSSDEDDIKYEDEPTSAVLRRTAESALEPGEEFTPEEQEELEHEIKEHGNSVVAPRAKPTPRRGMSLTTPFMVLLTSLLLAYGVWYRQEKIAVGYCGLGRPATQIIPPEFPAPEWLIPLVEPPCEPCPSHAYCYDNYQVRCESGFVYTPHPLSLGGLIPLPPTCEPDSAKARRVKQVADKTVEELREKRAQYECGGETTTTQDAPPERVETPDVRVEELKETTRKRTKRLNKQDFDELWDLALGEVKKRDEVVVKEKTNSGGVSDTYLHSTSLARLPLTCTIKRYVFGGLERHRFTIGAVIAVLVAAWYGRYRFLEHRRITAQVPGLVNLVLDRLAKQKALGEEDIDDPWLFLPNLRDDVLRSYHSLSQRERYWTKVREVVEQNSNVRTSQREGRSGEFGRAWEWIGPMDGDGARRRKSGRVSWGPDVKGEDSPEMGESKASAYSKWEESRPFY